MSINQNSLINYYENKEKFITDRERIYNIIRANPWGITTEQISNILQRPKNTFSGRLTELLKAKIIKEMAKNTRYSLDGKRTITEGIYIINYGLKRGETLKTPNKEDIQKETKNTPL